MDVVKSNELIEEDYELITKHLTQIRKSEMKEKLST